MGEEGGSPDPAIARAAITITEINQATTHLVELLELSTTIVFGCELARTRRIGRDNVVPVFTAAESQNTKKGS